MPPDPPSLQPGSGRFDDLQTGTSLRFASSSILSTHRIDEVIKVLRAAEQETRRGRWAFGFVAYEAAPAFDPSLATHDHRTTGLPLVWFGIGGPPSRDAARFGIPPQAVPPAAVWASEWHFDDYVGRVETIRNHIARGDSYQCNVTGRVRGLVAGSTDELYRHLAAAQAGAYNAHLDLGDWSILSASPELFFEWQRDRVSMRPMKGTAPRGSTPEDDERLAAALLASDKERAENIMIVDLIRNDLAKIAVTGSVQVPALLRLETYPTLHQLTSDVTAQVRADTTLVDLFGAVFPCGSVTGAPKARTMELICAVEDHPREVYCGAIGWLAPPSEPVRARFSVPIRTATVDHRTGRATFGVGSGITWDSDAASEYAETVTKSRILEVSSKPFHLFETLLYEPSTGLRNGPDHLRRLRVSAAALGFTCDPRVIDEELATALAGAACSRVRIQLAYDGRVAVTLSAPPTPTAVVTLAVDHLPVDPDDWRLRHKISYREAYESRRARHPAADDVIIINARRELTETSIANVAVELDGQWWTPPLTSGCLPGVERARLIRSGALRERVIPVTALDLQPPLAVMNSLRGWRPAHLIGAAGARTHQS